MLTKRIGIICGYSFPEGMGPTTRILAYSKGMVNNGARVDVYLYNPTDISKKKLQSSGSFQGINYCYPFRKNRIKNKLLHGFEIILGIALTLIKIIKEHRKEKFSAIIISNDAIYILFLFGSLNTLLGIKSIFIFDEFPIPIRKKLKENIPKYKRHLYRQVLRMIDGYIGMTENLISFYKEIRKKPSLIISSVTDLTRFENSNCRKSKMYICYMGNMELSKDNIDNIIFAFSKINTVNKEIELHLYGQPNITDEIKIRNLIKKLSLEDKVFLKGKISYEQVPNVLAGAHILVSSQPNTRRAEGGFPTKLGEYMATGIPVLLTDVGEISNYIQDGINGYLCEPENPDAFAAKLEFIINNYSKAQQVAHKGKQYIYENYSHIIAGKKMLDFIETL